MNSYTRFETKVLTAFIATMIVVLGLTAATWKVAIDASQAVQWIEHTDQVIDGLLRVRSHTLQIEFSTQSFRISGDPERLVERDASIARRETLLEQIRLLTIDNPEQRARWEQLRQVIDERLAISRQVEQLRKTQGQPAANAYVATAPLKETRTRTYELLREMENDETQLLDKRSAEYQDAHDRMATMGTLAAALLLLLLSITYVLIRRQLHETETGRRALADSEANLAITLHSIGDGVLVTDRQGHVTRLNPVAELLTGWPQEQALGRPVAEVFRTIDEDKRASTSTHIEKVLATGEVQNLASHTTLISRHGHEYPIAESAAPVRHATEQVQGVVMVFRDVSAERQVQRSIQQQNEWLERRVLERTAQLQESEDHLRSIINAVPVLIAYVDADRHYVYVNDQYRERFAPGQMDITGCAVDEVLGQERYAIADPIITRVLTGTPQNYDWQPFPGVWQNISYVPRCDETGLIDGYYVLGVDITERKIAEEQIRQLNVELAGRLEELEHVSRALRTLSAGNRTLVRATEKQDLLDGMCDVITSSGDYRYAAVWYCNEDEQCSMQLKSQSGFPEGHDVLATLRPSWGDNERGQSVIGTAIRSGRTTVARDLLSNPAYAPWRDHLHGVAAGLACPLNVGGRVIGVLSIYSDSPDAFNDKEVILLTELADDLAFGIGLMRSRAERQRIQDAMQHLMHHDPLTGLPNETQFTAVLANTIDGGRPFALLQTNIERLSEINDALGFSQGDQLLRAFAERLRLTVPAEAVVARLRGDEFAVLLPEGHVGTALPLARRMEQSLAEPFAIADIALDVLVKMGVVLYPEHGSTPHDLFRHMDMAMHQAKRHNSAYAVFDPLQDPNPAQRLTLAGELRRAIENGDLALYLQPKVEITTGRICGVEALVRWPHPARGMVHPGEFIELAEHTGLIRPLTDWVIETAFRLNHTWHRQGQSLPIAVNLSARNLRDENLLERIRQLQTTWNLPPGLLEIEITESAVMDDAELALRVLQGLRDQGIPLYIDDFGTGYSSLSYLQRLPVGCIKIDQSFVQSMPTNKDSMLIVRSTIDLAHDMGRLVVAEGVETREHWEQLAAFGCDIVQGYLIARPMPADTFQAWRNSYQPLTSQAVQG